MQKWPMFTRQVESSMMKERGTRPRGLQDLDPRGLRRARAGGDVRHVAEEGVGAQGHRRRPQGSSRLQELTTCRDPHRHPPLAPVPGAPAAAYHRWPGTPRTGPVPAGGRAPGRLPPHIAAIYGFEEADGKPLQVLELIQGEDLSPGTTAAVK